MDKALQQDRAGLYLQRYAEFGRDVDVLSAKQLLMVQVDIYVGVLDQVSGTFGLFQQQ